jgi:transposase
MRSLKSSRERIETWRSEGVPDDLKEMLSANVPLQRIIVHTDYNGVEIRAAAKMLGVKVRQKRKYLSLGQERKMRAMLMQGMTYRIIAGKMGISESAARTHAIDILSYYPGDKTCGK